MAVQKKRKGTSNIIYVGAHVLYYGSIPDVESQNLKQR